MSVLYFNAFEYFEKLKSAGVPEEQARVLTNGMNAQSESLHEAIRAYDESRQKELATKGDLESRALALKKDILDSRLQHEKEIQEVRLEIEKVRAEVKGVETRLLKWQIGIAVAILLVMAKGFNWLGF